MGKGPLIATIVVIIIVAVFLGVYFGNVACPTFGNNCSTSDSTTPGTTSPGTTSPGTSGSRTSTGISGSRTSTGISGSRAGGPTIYTPGSSGTSGTSGTPAPEPRTDCPANTRPSANGITCTTLPADSYWDNDSGEAYTTCSPTQRINALRTSCTDLPVGSYWTNASGDAYSTCSSNQRLSGSSCVTLPISAWWTSSTGVGYFDCATVSGGASKDPAGNSCICPGRKQWQGAPSNSCNACPTLSSTEYWADNTGCRKLTFTSSCSPGITINNTVKSQGTETTAGHDAVCDGGWGCNGNFRALKFWAEDVPGAALGTLTSKLCSDGLSAPCGQTLTERWAQYKDGGLGCDEYQIFTNACPVTACAVNTPPSTNCVLGAGYRTLDNTGVYTPRSCQYIVENLVACSPRAGMPINIALSHTIDTPATGTGTCNNPAVPVSCPGYYRPTCTPCSPASPSDTTCVDVNRCLSNPIYCD
jgi:hypothetical protein